MVRISRTTWVVLAFAVFLPVSCMLGNERQQWRSSRGPVVPHDTFPGDCSLCHVTKDWHTLRADFAFDHAKETGHALAGAHDKAQCLRCHNDRGPVAVFAKRGCRGCHEDVHRGELGVDCASCHDETTWRPRAQIARHASTRFPLAGAHAAVACFRCHGGAEVGNFKRADTRCESCHGDDLARARSPDHAARGWVKDCQRCHRPTAWSSARFDHATFPLRGAHATAACTKCHTGGRFRGLSRNCVDCHSAEYENTTAPNHRTAMFSTDCQSCHSATGWQPARFAHETWALTGAHRALSCAKCHIANKYKGTSRTCAGCHQGDYDRTTAPNHRTASFPRTCETCHTTSTWKGAKFNHVFPIDRGAHKGIGCAECHKQPNNFKAFTCTDCHEHLQSKMNSKHKGVSGYAWSSPACFKCHPNGKG